MSDKIALAITPTDLLVMSEDLVVPSLLERFNTLYPSLNLTMDDYNAKLKGLGRQKLVDKIVEAFPDRAAGCDFDLDKIYEGRDAACMNDYAKHGTRMADGAIEALTAVKGMGVELLLVSSNSVQRGMRAIKSSSNGRGNELLALFEGNFYEAQGLQAQDKKKTTGTALQLLCQHEGLAQGNVVVFCRASGVKAFIDAGFNKIIGSIGGSKTVERDTDALLDKGAVDVVGPLADLPAVVARVMNEKVLAPGRPALVLAPDRLKR